METIPKQSWNTNEERNILIKKLNAKGLSNRKIAAELGISHPTVSDVLKNLPLNLPSNGKSIEPIADDTGKKIIPEVLPVSISLTNDEQIIYDFLKLVSPLVCSRGRLPEIKGNTNEIILSLQSKVNHGFQLDENKIYQGESLDDMVCDMFRFRDWSITGE